MTALLEQPTNEIGQSFDVAPESLSAVRTNNRCQPYNATWVLRWEMICVFTIVVGLVWRAWQFGEVPGVNGDEAWYGVQSQRFLDEYVYGKSLPLAERVNFRTPTGNIWNPFLMIPRIFLDAGFEPSVSSLRLPALISGVLTLFVNWWLCQRALNCATAWLTTALLSVLPIALIYSRLGWDSCQSILFCLPLVYLPWISEKAAWSGRRTAAWLFLALAAALVVHPTNIFLVPMTVVLLGPRLLEAAKWEWLLQSRRLLAAGAIGGAFAFGYLRGSWADVSPHHLFSALLRWANDIAGLFHGATVYGSISLPDQELSAAQGWLLLWSVPTIALLAVTRWRCCVCFLDMQTKHPEQRYAALSDGICVALCCFLGVAGPAAVMPGYERYGLWLIAPGVLLVVLAYQSLAKRSRGALVVVSILAILQVVLLLAGYWQYFLRRFEVPAAEQRLAHWTYRTHDFSTWAEMRAKLEQSVTSPSNSSNKVILVWQNDPQRWWFEWKWRYLSHGSEFEWQVGNHFQDAKTQKKLDTRVWILSSQQDFEKENLAIQYLSD